MQISARTVTKKVQEALEAKGYHRVENLPFKTLSGQIYRTVIDGKRAIVVGISSTNAKNKRYTNYRGYAKKIDNAPKPLVIALQAKESLVVPLFAASILEKFDKNTAQIIAYIEGSLQSLSKKKWNGTFYRAKNGECAIYVDEHKIVLSDSDALGIEQYFVECAMAGTKSYLAKYPAELESFFQRITEGKVRNFSEYQTFKNSLGILPDNDFFKRFWAQYCELTLMKISGLEFDEILFKTFANVI